LSTTILDRDLSASLTAEMLRMYGSHNTAICAISLKVH